MYSPPGWSNSAPPNRSACVRNGSTPRNWMPTRRMGATPVFMSLRRRTGMLRTEPSDAASSMDSRQADTSSRRPCRQCLRSSTNVLASNPMAIPPNTVPSTVATSTMNHTLQAKEAR